MQLQIRQCFECWLRNGTNADEAMLILFTDDVETDASYPDDDP